MGQIQTPDTSDCKDVHSVLRLFVATSFFFVPAGLHSRSFGSLLIAFRQYTK